MSSKDVMRFLCFDQKSKLSIVNYTCSAALLAALSVSQAQAKEREPEPIEKPGECQVDAPIRVASVDSLRHFSGLLGHCPETTVIESPAFKANRPRAGAKGTVISDDRSVVPNGTDNRRNLDADPRFILANAKVPKTPAKTSDKQAAGTEHKTEMFELGDGSVVAIIPPKSARMPVGADGYGGAAASDALSGSDEAVLALGPQSYGTKFDGIIDQAARVHRVDPLLLHAVIKQESRYRDRAVSSAGARGLMQVMPGTGRDLGVKNAQHLFDPSTNINAGAKLLSRLWQKFDGNLELVLAAYNAGEGAVRKHGMQIPPYRETRDYVAKVKANYAKLAGENGIAVNF